MENRHQPDWIFILGLPVFIIFLTILGWWWRPSYPQANPEQSSPALRADENSPIVWKQVPIALPDSEIVDTGDPDWLWFKSYEYDFQIKFPREWECIKSFKTNSEDLELGLSPSCEDFLIKIYLVNNNSSVLLKKLYGTGSQRIDSSYGYKIFIIEGNNQPKINEVIESFSFL